MSARFALAVEVVAVLALLVLGAWQLRVVVLGDSANSRLATAYALVHHGTWNIDNPDGDQPNPFAANTVDKAEVSGRIQSTKPPLLPLLMTAQYAVMHHGLGWTLDDRDQARTLVRSMVVLLMLFPLALGTLAFRASLQQLAAKPWTRAYLLVALCMGSQALGFAGHINNHTPAMAALCIAIWAVLPALLGQPIGSTRALLFGLAGGAVFTLDLPVTIYVALLGLALLYRSPRQAMTWAAAGIALPVLIHMGALYISTGSILPIQMHPDWYLYRDAYWRSPGGVDALNEPKGSYLFNLTLGRYGTFILFPVLLTAVAGCWVALRKPSDVRSILTLVAGLGFVVLTAYFVMKTNNYGGAAYGFRWHLASAPVLLLMGAMAIDGARNRAWMVLLVGLLVVSCFSAWECYQNPWSKDLEWTARYLYGPGM